MELLIHPDCAIKQAPSDVGGASWQILEDPEISNVLTISGYLNSGWGGEGRGRGVKYSEDDEGADKEAQYGG